MKIIDLTEKYLNTYYYCLEDWFDEMKDAGNHKEKWHCQMKDKGHRVKLAIEDDNAAGMIQYTLLNSLLSMDTSFISFSTSGYTAIKGIGNHQKKGWGMLSFKPQKKTPNQGVPKAWLPGEYRCLSG